MAITVSAARTPEDFEAFGTLVRQFVAWAMGTYHPGETRLSAPLARVEEELASLPGKYAAPDGEILLARRDGTPIGCLAGFRHGPDSLEVTRMWVTPEARGRGAGVALVDALLTRAAASGYSRAVLRSRKEMTSAHRVYAQAGFDYCDGAAFFPNFMPIEVAMQRALP